MATQLNITHLSHDLVARKSYVNFVWADDPNKRLGLEVPFGTLPHDAETEARKAIEALSTELAGCVLVMPEL